MTWINTVLLQHQFLGAGARESVGRLRGRHTRVGGTTSGLCGRLGNLEVYPYTRWRIYVLGEASLAVKTKR